jgi:hypothetical protein
VSRHLGDDGFVVRLAEAAISTSSVHSAGDFVARRERSIRPETFEAFVDVEPFTRRTDALLGRAGLARISHITVQLRPAT